MTIPPSLLKEFPSLLLSISRSLEGRTEGI